MNLQVFTVINEGWLSPNPACWLYGLEITTINFLTIITHFVISFLLHNKKITCHLHHFHVNVRWGYKDASFLINVLIRVGVHNKLHAASVRNEKAYNKRTLHTFKFLPLEILKILIKKKH